VLAPASDAWLGGLLNSSLVQTFEPLATSIGLPAGRGMLRDLLHHGNCLVQYGLLQMLQCFDASLPVLATRRCYGLNASCCDVLQASSSQAAYWQLEWLLLFCCWSWKASWIQAPGCCNSSGLLQVCQTIHTLLKHGLDARQGLDTNHSHPIQHDALRELQAQHARFATHRRC